MEYGKMNEQILAQLEAVVPGYVYSGESIKPDYAHDEMPIYANHMPSAVVMVNTTEEISAVCKICYENNIPFTPRGAGTGLAGGCTDLADGIIIDMTRMNKILGYDLESFTVRAQPGVLLEELANDCLSKGVFYPPDPGEKLATLGGNVSTNAGGMRAVKYGTTRDYVKAMTVVMPNGEIMRLGAEVVKSCSGYSLMHLVIGAEGTLAIITELSLKVTPQPKSVISLAGLYPDLSSCISSVPKIKIAGFDPQALEFMTKNNIMSAEKYCGKNVYPDKVEGESVEAVLLTTFEGKNEDELMEMAEQAAEILLEDGALDVLVFDTPEQYRNAWLVRGSVLEGILADVTITDECDIVVPISKIAEFVNYAASLEEETGLIVRATGHAGDGNVHINICANEMDEKEFHERAEKFMEKAYAKAYEVGGAISGEHGIGVARLQYMEMFLGKAQLELMVNIKKTFDPKMLLNPGKVCYSL